MTRNPVLLPTLFLFLLAVQTVSAQYYYKDLLSMRESVRQQQLYNANRVREITIQSFDPDGSENKDFFCRQTVGKEGTRLETHSGSPATGETYLVSLFSPGDYRILSSEDSSRDAVTDTRYTYDRSGNAATITSDSRTADTSTTDTTNFYAGEQHIWQYTSTGHPLGMLRVKGGTDTTFVRFILDSAGDITDEISVRKGVTTEHYFYYYDDAHRLTDIARYNARLGQTLPDYIFEYDGESGRLSRMTVVQAINSNYLVWYYEYDPNGLTVKQFCYDKSKQLIGTIGYTYH